jgi:hypothetical protein
MSQNIINEDWKFILFQLSEIRDQNDYSTANVSFIQEHLVSEDEKIRAAATLTAEGCLFEPNIIEMIIDIAEHDAVMAVRKAAIKVFEGIIYEGVVQDFENQSGASTDLDNSEEWDDIQLEMLKDDYLRVKDMLLNFIENEFEEQTIREVALISISDLGFLSIIREWIQVFLEFEAHSSKLAALTAMGKYPQYWIAQLEKYLIPDTAKSLLIEAISSSYSSESETLARKIVHLLEVDDPQIIEYALLTLGNINKIKNLGSILQNFSLHPDKNIQKAAREAIENYSKKSFSSYLQDEFGMEE